MPKTVDTRRHCEVNATIFRNPEKRCRDGIAEDCCMLSTLPRSAFLYLHFLAQCHPYILLRVLSGDFILGGKHGLTTSRTVRRGSSRGICYKPALAFNTRIMHLHVSNTTRLSSLNNTWSVNKNRTIPV